MPRLQVYATLVILGVFWFLLSLLTPPSPSVATKWVQVTTGPTPKKRVLIEQPADNFRKNFVVLKDSDSVLHVLAQKHSKFYVSLSDRVITKAVVRGYPPDKNPVTLVTGTVDKVGLVVEMADTPIVGELAPGNKTLFVQPENSWNFNIPLDFSASMTLGNFLPDRVLELTLPHRPTVYCWYKDSVVECNEDIAPMEIKNNVLRGIAPEFLQTVYTVWVPGMKWQPKNGKRYQKGLILERGTIIPGPQYDWGLKLAWHTSVV